MERPIQEPPPLLSCRHTRITPQGQAVLILWQAHTLLPVFSDLQPGNNLCSKELPPVLITTYNAGNSGDGFPDIYSPAISLDAVVPSFKSLFCLLNLQQPSSATMWGSCSIRLFYHEQCSRAMSGWTYRPKWISFYNIQKAYGLLCTMWKEFIFI